MTQLLPTLRHAIGLMPHGVPPGSIASMLLQLLLLKARSDTWQQEVAQAEKAGATLADFNAAQIQRRQLRMTAACLYDNCMVAPPDETGKAIRDALLAFATCQAHSELHGVFQPEQFLRLDALFRQHGKTTHLADMVRALGELSFADILPSPALGEVIAQTFMALGLGPDPAQCEAAQLMVQLLALENGQRLYDPACGQGILLYAAASHLAQFEPDAALGLYGMTANQNDFTVASILFILCGQPQARLHLRNCLDGVPRQNPQSDLVQADRVLSIIPDAGVAWHHALALLDADPRFPVRPPADSRVAQFWIALASVNRTGFMAASIPAHLFDSVDGQALRGYLLKHNLLEAVIAWPTPATGASPVMKGRTLVLVNRQNPHGGSAWIGPGLGNPATDSALPYDADNILMAYSAWLQQKSNSALTGPVISAAYPHLPEPTMEMIDNAPHVLLAQLLTFYPEPDLGARSPDKDMGCVSADMLETEWPLVAVRREHENAPFEYRNIAQPGDVVLPRGQYGAQQGNVSLLISPRLGDCAELAFDRIACPAGCLVLRPDRTRLDGLYLLYFLRHPATRQKMDEFKQQNHCKSDPVRAFLQSCTIPLPDLALQRQWVVQWQRHCATLMLLRQKIALYGDGQWREVQAFFRKTRTASATWPSIKLGRLASLRFASDGAWRNYLAAAGTPLIGLAALGVLRLEPARLAWVQDVPQRGRAWPRVQAGDVLLAIHGTPGRAVVVPPELAGACIGPGIVSLRVRDAEPAWLAAWLCSGPSLAWFENMLGMRRSGSLSKTILRKLPILLPPMELQTFVADSMAQYASQLAQLTAQLARQQHEFAESNRAAFGLQRALPGNPTPKT